MPTQEVTTRSKSRTNDVETWLVRWWRKFLELGNESDRDEWTLHELDSSYLLDSIHLFFRVFSVHEIGSASREFWGHFNAMLFFLEPIIRTRDVFLPDYFLERLCVTLNYDSCVSSRCTVEYFFAELCVPDGSFPV